MNRSLHLAFLTRDDHLLQLAPILLLRQRVLRPGGRGPRHHVLLVGQRQGFHGFGLGDGLGLAQQLRALSFIRSDPRRELPFLALAVPATAAGIGTYDYLTLVAAKGIDVPADKATAYVLTMHALTVIPITLLGVALVRPAFPRLFRRHETLEEPV